MSRRNQVDYLRPSGILTEPWRICIWIPGNAKPKLRPAPGVSPGGTAYLRDTPENKIREGEVYDYVLAYLRQNHYWKAVQYLPVQKPTIVTLTGRFWFQTASWERPHLEPPDLSNLLKCIEDAVTGRLVQRPPLIYHDDSQVIRYLPDSGKEYWDPDFAFQWIQANYPSEPGYQITFTIYPPGYSVPKLLLLDETAPLW